MDALGQGACLTLVVLEELIGRPMDQPRVLAQEQVHTSGAVPLGGMPPTVTPAAP